MVADKFLADDSEKARSARILVPARRRSFLFRRAARRHVLRQYLNDWQLEHTPEGKPQIFGAPLHFSASNSLDLCAVAVSAGEVGVDIVASSSSLDLSRLCARYVPRFVEPAMCPEAVRQATGRWHWAQFEARLKLHGERLFDALTSPAAESGTTHCHEVVIAAASYVCAVARSVPFRLARLEILPFAKVTANAE